MRLGYELTIEQQQKLVMTPELLQAIQILQYNSYELDAFVNEQLITNPVLEQDKSFEKKETLTREEAIGQFIGEYGGYTKGSGTYKSDEEENNYENYITSETTLSDHLLYQLQFVCKTKEQSDIGKFIIESLDENGYLTLSSDAIAKTLDVSSEKVMDVLDKIQQFDPLGIAAIDLRDCLKRQLELTGRLDDVTEAVLDNHLENIASNKLNDIAKAVGISTSKAQEIADLIKGLDPKPGCCFGNNTKTTYVVPDIFVNKNNEGEYEVEINGFTAPGLVVSPYYEHLMHDKNSDEIVKNYLTEKMESAVWLIKSIQQRKQTITNVAKSIVKFQSEFFDKGEKFLKPMTLKQIADEVDIHESTVSRAINGKYLQCQRGVYELKFFFSTGVYSNGGEEVSSNSIKKYLKELIDSENPKSPFSDQKLVEMLKEKGFSISRRTVAKYRDEMNIASSSKRKRY